MWLLDLLDALLILDFIEWLFRSRVGNVVLVAFVASVLALTIWLIAL